MSPPPWRCQSGSHCAQRYPGLGVPTAVPAPTHTGLGAGGPGAGLGTQAEPKPAVRAEHRMQCLPKGLHHSGTLRVPVPASTWQPGGPPDKNLPAASLEGTSVERETGMQGHSKNCSVLGSIAGNYVFRPRYPLANKPLESPCASSRAGSSGPRRIPARFPPMFAVLWRRLEGGSLNKTCSW